MSEKKRNYKKENKKALEKNFRVNLKIDRKYKKKVEEIKKSEGITNFFLNSLRNYYIGGSLTLTDSETANLIAIIESFISEREENYNKIDNGKYIKEIKRLKNKIENYYDS